MTGSGASWRWAGAALGAVGGLFILGILVALAGPPRSESQGDARRQGKPSRGLPRMNQDGGRAERHAV